MANKEMTQTTREMAPWDPIKDLFEDMFGTLPSFRLSVTPRAWTPKVNIKETDKEYVITAAIPGVKKEDVKVSVQDGVLYITGEHKEEKEEKSKGYLRQEMSYGSFQRSFVLPADIHPEDVKATQKDGLLTVRLPKGEPAKSRGVHVKVE